MRPLAETAVQSTIEGLAPVPRPNILELLDAGHPLHVAVKGTITSQATVRQDSHGAVLLEVVLHQHVEHHPQALPLYAAQVIDEGTPGDSLDRARLLAARLPHGTEVVALGRGLEPGHHCRAPVLRLLHTIGITRADAINPPPEGTHAH